MNEPESAELPSEKQELAQDLLSIVNVFVALNNGLGSGKVIIDDNEDVIHSNPKKLKAMKIQVYPTADQRILFSQ